jgi:hypothetical protein
MQLVIFFTSVALFLCFIMSSVPSCCSALMILDETDDMKNLQIKLCLFTPCVRCDRPKIVNLQKLLQTTNYVKVMQMTAENNKIYIPWILDNPVTEYVSTCQFQSLNSRRKGRNTLGTTYWLLLCFIFCQIVDGEEVPEAIVKQYANYCQLATTCPAKWTVCHFCIFEIQSSGSFTVLTSDVSNTPVIHHIFQQTPLEFVLSSFFCT